MFGIDWVLLLIITMGSTWLIAVVITKCYDWRRDHE